MSDRRPNIVFVFSDQQRYSALGANGNRVVRTPVLDGMAAEGMVCDNMFSNHPLCSPYRAILLTGQFGWRNGVIDNEYRPRRDIPTLPGTLREHGYGTAHVGTFHLGKPPYTEEGRYGIDYLAAVGVGRGYFDQPYYENERGPVVFPGWGPTVETDLAIRYLERHRDRAAGRPVRPVPVVAAPALAVRAVSRTPSSATIRPRSILPANVPEALADHARRELADYYACCTGLDVEMGRLLAALDRLQVADDTIVCYTSDHGDHIRAHGYGKPNETWLHNTRRASKATPYEDSAHVPFVVRWPGNTPPGTRSDAFMGAIDIVPSLLGACGVPAPAGLQGRDLSPVWRGQPVPADPPHAPGASESVYLMNMAHGWPNRYGWVGRWRAVRTARYTYARWYANERSPWLFDRQEDPLEMNNLAYSAAARPVVQEMEERLHRWMEATGDPFEHGARGDRGFVEVGQQWADPDKWAEWGTS